MEHTAAKLNDNNVVEQVIVGSHLWAIERLGGNWIDSTGLQVGIGYSYHGDHFRSPPLFPSWLWENGHWNPPIPYPQDGQSYYWDEETTSWIVRTET